MECCESLFGDLVQKKSSGHQTTFLFRPFETSRENCIRPFFTLLCSWKTLSSREDLPGGYEASQPVQPQYVPGRYFSCLSLPNHFFEFLSPFEHPESRELLPQLNAALGWPY